MSYKERTAEEACVAYYEASKEISKVSHLIALRSCDLECPNEFQPGWPGHADNGTEHCLTRLFQIKRDPNEREEHYQEEIAECEDSLCDSCTETLKMIRQRRVLRVALGAKKRAISAVGKRIIAKGNKCLNI